jgi:hypothetical protein
MIGQAGLIGTTEQCLNRARTYRDLGVDEIACLIDFGVDRDGVLASLENVRDLKDTLVL